MKNPYQQILPLWSSSGSAKGDMLLKYAQDALQLLKKGKSIKFISDGPVSMIANGKKQTLGFFSGGTSGPPEMVTHSPATLHAAVNGLLGRIGSTPLNSICCLPLWHVGGWMQLERAWATEGEVLFCDYRDLIEIEFRKCLDGKWISLVPTQLQELVKYKHAVEHLKQINGIFVGGAAMSSRLIETCRSLKLNVIPCYGSSETAGMVTLLDSISFLQGDAGVGRPLSHAQVRINPQNSHVQIKSSSLCLSRGKKKFVQDSWIESPDFGLLDHCGNLLIKGRSDRVINTGGEKIHPSIIEQILYSSGLVDQCLVYGAADEKWGQRVVAVVTPKNIDLTHLRKVLKKDLVGPLEPKEWKVVENIPTSEMGKLRQDCNNG